MARPFILDRPGYVRDSAVLDTSTERTALEDQFRAAFDAYYAHRARRAALPKAITAISTRLAANPDDPDLIAASVRLTAESTAWPAVYEQLARDYYAALVAWANHTTRELQRVHNAAVDDLNTRFPAWQAATGKLDRFGPNTPQGQEAKQELARIRELDADHIRRRDTAARAIGSVDTFVNMETGTPLRMARLDRFLEVTRPKAAA